MPDFASVAWFVFACLALPAFFFFFLKNKCTLLGRVALLEIYMVSTAYKSKNFY